MRRPSEGAAVIGMLALGIGITTAMFTMVDALILRPVPFHRARAARLRLHAERNRRAHNDRSRRASRVA